MLRSKENRITQIVAHIFCGAAAMIAVLPFILLVIGSFTDNTWAASNGFTFFPSEFSLDAYRYIGVRSDLFGRAYMMSVIVTAIGTVSSILITTTFAYSISRTEVPGMKILSFLLVFTMLFNGGLVATYYTYIRIFGIRDTIWALLVPNLLMNAFNVILVRNYYVHSIPPSLLEAARVDGASEFRIFARIVFPLSKPIIATVGLLTALHYWNDWQNGLYYLSARGGEHLYTIQIILNNINENIQTLMQNAAQLAAIGATGIQFPSTTVRMALGAIGILPIIVIYPFFQQYFVKGITLGGVKE